jgi:hypothetical protein
MVVIVVGVPEGGADHPEVEVPGETGVIEDRTQGAIIMGLMTTTVKKARTFLNTARERGRNWKRLAFGAALLRRALRKESTKKKDHDHEQGQGHRLDHDHAVVQNHQQKKGRTSKVQ